MNQITALKNKVTNLQNRVDELSDMFVAMKRDHDELTFQFDCLMRERHAKICAEVEQYEVKKYVEEYALNALRKANESIAIAEGAVLDAAIISA